MTDFTTMFEDEDLIAYAKRIESGEELDESDIEELIYSLPLEKTDGDDVGDWTSTVFSYELSKDGTMGIGVYWECGNTEEQPNEYPNQPFLFTIKKEEVRSIKTSFTKVGETDAFEEEIVEVKA